MRPFFRVLLWPVSVLFGLLVRFRNHLYDIGYKKSFIFQCGVVSVGNLSVGGNGKTPMVEYLVRLLHPAQLAVLSRGYGRISRGFRLANEDHTADDIGDEPMQIYRKFRPDLTVAVGESRVLAIPKILLENPKVETIVLDDAYQHRSVVPHLSIVVTDYWAPFFRDHLLPSGRLREPRAAISRADIVVVTKCPIELNQEIRREIINEIQSFKQEIDVFFSHIEYRDPVHFISGEISLSPDNVLLLSGIARSDMLVKQVRERYQLFDHLQFGDHYRYRKKDIHNILTRYHAIPGERTIILTTEKDAMRLMKFKEMLKDIPLYFLPIECRFLEHGDKFDQLVLNRLKSVVKSNG